MLAVDVHQRPGCPGATVSAAIHSIVGAVALDDQNSIVWIYAGCAGMTQVDVKFEVSDPFKQGLCLTFGLLPAGSTSLRIPATLTNLDELLLASRIYCLNKVRQMADPGGWHERGVRRLGWEFAACRNIHTHASPRSMC